MSAGGFGDVKEPTADEYAVLESVKSTIEEQLLRSFVELRIVHFKTQVVAGVNYLMKVQLDGTDFIHVKICKPLPHTGNPPFVMRIDFEGIDADSPLDP
eukprot:gene14088-18907_t